MRFFFFAIFLVCTNWVYGICFFCPPDQWNTADPSSLSPLVKVGFYGPPSQLGFCPSINLAEEKIRCSLKDYLDAVKKIHTSNRHKVWTYLGTLKTQAGEAALTQIDLPSQSGPMRLLQLILVNKDKAYILTASCLKKEFAQLLPLFRKAFYSLQIENDLYQAIPDPKSRERARHSYAYVEKAVRTGESFSIDMDEWKSFQANIIEKFTDLGPYWQALVIAEAYRKLQSLNSSEPLAACIPLIETILDEIDLKTRPRPLERPFLRHLQFIKSGL